MENVRRIEEDFDLRYFAYSKFRSRSINEWGRSKANEFVEAIVEVVDMLGLKGTEDGKLLKLII